MNANEIIYVTYEGSLAEYKGVLVKTVSPISMTHAVTGEAMVHAVLVDGTSMACRQSSLQACATVSLHELHVNSYTA